MCRPLTNRAKDMKVALKTSIFVLLMVGFAALYLMRWPLNYQEFSPKSRPGLFGISSTITSSDINESDRGLWQIDGRAARTYRRILQVKGYDEVMLSRYLTMAKHCPSELTHAKLRAGFHLLASLRFKFIFCFVPKIGCSFWKTVLHALEDPNISPENFTSKLLITDMAIHTMELPVANAQKIPNPGSFYRTSPAIVFTRNPYSRLFSAYVSKFVLPMFWRSMSRDIIKLVRPDASQQSLTCAHNVTFEEFLRYVIRKDQIGSGLHDHWAPVTSLCDVCQMKYDYIGKQESFSTDVDYIFHKLGVDKLILKNLTKLDTSRNWIESVMTHNWFVWSSECISRQGALRRMWYSFQTQGNMTFDSEPPWQNLDLSTATRPEVVQAFQTSYDQNKPTAEQRKQQRHKALIDAYSTVPVEVKRGIQHVFRYDFELFGYDKEPQELYV